MPSESNVQGHTPVAEEVKFTLGPYQILSSIGKGGMGEVFLAYDTSCGRRIALKRIREDLAHHTQLYNRFMKEARITGQLAHPSIIPIYAIHQEEGLLYYTMPFVEGETLKQILKLAREQEKQGKKSEPIPTLVRLFLGICQAIAYAHSKGVLHRDLKPENVMIGKYGEVMILDWGLAKMVGASESALATEEVGVLHGHTNIGKVVGTVTYMAPERALGKPASMQSDIYSLGIILYQILTLHLPFHRNTISEFRKVMHREVLRDPVELAPYRDVPRLLANITEKCLEANPEQRYKNVDALIHDLEGYIEGRSEWFRISELNIHKKEDWEFQENVFIAEHMAITRHTEVSEWVSLMISKASFPENLKIEAKVRLGDRGHGIGFLLSIPETNEREHLNDGYCLWIGSEDDRGTRLLRSTVEVMNSQEIFLKRHEWVDVRMEKVENSLHIYINSVLQWTYISYLPLSGTHVGLISRDADFEIQDFTLFASSPSIMVSCLAVPDAFLAHKDYKKALTEYRRIGYSFPGRAEGREALFRAGITLLEESNYDLALEEFEKLHDTPGAPLEYLGKALVYEAQKEYGEELKCLELALRRYPKHPLLHLLQEHILARMHTSSRLHRRTTYNFILLMVRYLPNNLINESARKLLQRLQKHWEPLYFIEETAPFAIPLAFWLGKTYVLEEILAENPDPNAVFSLLEIGVTPHITTSDPGLTIAIHAKNIPLQESIDKTFTLPNPPKRLILFLLEEAIRRRDTQAIHTIVSKHPDDRYEIFAHLLDKDFIKAGECFHRHPIEELSKETTLLHFLYGCWLTVTEGKEIADAHFSGILEMPYPRSWTLGSHYLMGKIGKDQRFFDRAFPYEKRQLYRQLSLFYHCTGNQELASHYHKLELLTFPSDSQYHG